MGVVNKVPAIRFKGFSEEWVNNPIEDICGTTFGGGTPSTNEKSFWHGKIPWIQSSDLKNGTVDSVIAKKYITQTAVIKSATKLISGNSIAIVTRVGVGKLSLMKYEYTTSQDFLSLSNPKVDPQYLVYVLWKQLQIDKEQVQGTSIKGITKEDLLSKIINYPQINSEQTAIGNYFQKLDSLINQHQQKHDQLSNIKKAMLEKMFPKQGETIPEIRFKRFSMEWKHVSLGEICEFMKGQSLNWKDIDSAGKNPCILYGHLYTTYGMTISKISYFTNNDNKNIPRSYHGDILIPGSDTTPTGIARAACIELDNVLLGGDINILRPAENINGQCLSYCINANRNQLIKLIKGTSVKHLVNSDLAVINIKIPMKLEEQTAIGNFFQKLDTLINQHQQQITKLNNIKQACLSKMFV